MNLIVISNLTDNEGLYFRLLTMIAKTDLEYDILVESEESTLDDDYKLLTKYLIKYSNIQNILIYVLIKLSLASIIRVIHRII